MNGPQGWVGGGGMNDPGVGGDGPVGAGVGGGELERSWEGGPRRTRGGGGNCPEDERSRMGEGGGECERLGGYKLTDYGLNCPEGRGGGVNCPTDKRFVGR